MRKYLAVVAVFAAGFSIASALPVGADEIESPPKKSDIPAPVDGPADAKACMDILDSAGLLLHYCTRAIESGEISGEDLGWVYLHRGMAHDMNGDYELAIADYGESVKNPIPEVPFVYRWRGFSRFYVGEYAAAAGDFAVSLDSGPDDAQDAMWLYLSRMRAGEGKEDALKDFMATAELIDKTRWPWPMVAMFLGDIAPEEAMRTARDRDAHINSTRRCEAHFFVGQNDLIRGDLDAAAEHFRAAVLFTGTDDMACHRGSEAERARLAR